MVKRTKVERKQATKKSALKTSRKTAPENEGGKRMDIRDIAKRVGVSVATVSRVTNNVSTVAPELAERVWKVVHELNYIPNRQARALVSGRSRIFGLLISEITNPFFPELIQGFEDIAMENGYEILTGSTNDDPERLKLCIRRMLQHNVEGAAVMTFGIDAPLGELALRDLPLVFIDAAPSLPKTTVLEVNYEQGIDQAIQHLAALGHRRIGFIEGPQRIYSAQRRKAAFLAGLQKIGVSSNAAWVVKGDHTLEGGIRAMETILAMGNRPTAILCSNDMTAIGALRVLASRGVRVPEEMSIVGFDDIHLAEFVTPPLTSISMQRTELARAAFGALRQHIEQPQKTHPRSIRIETSLNIRQSTSFPAGSLDDLNKPGSTKRRAR